MAKTKEPKTAAQAATPGSDVQPPSGDPINDILAEGKCIPVEICGTQPGCSVTVQGTGAGGTVPVSGSVAVAMPAGRAVPVSGPPGPNGDPQPVPVSVASSVPVQLQRSESSPSDDQAFWAAIRDRTAAIGFDAYEDFIETCLCQAPPEENSNGPCDAHPADLLHFGVDGYRRLRTATEAFLILHCGLVPEVSSFDPVDERSRFGRAVSAGEVGTILNRYLANGELPYILGLLGPEELASQSISPYCDTVLTGSSWM